MSSVAVSVVIPTYNRSSSLERTLDSLLRVDFPSEQFEIVVVDNNSTDATPLVARRYQTQGVRLTYVREVRLSFTVARHTGAVAARGAILAYIDDDVVVDRGWLGAIADAFQKDPKAGVVGGPILPEFEQEPPNWLKTYYPMSHWLSLMDLGPSFQEAQWAQGPNMAVSKALLEQVGGFPADTIGVEAEGQSGVVEKIYVGSGDGGLCDRVRAAGYRVLYAPGALVHHVIPPIRITKKWWHSRFAGEGCFHAINRQWEQNETRAQILAHALLSCRRLLAYSVRFATSAVFRTGKERHEFWMSYYLTKVRVEAALIRRPDLARRLWEIAISGVAPDDIQDLVRLLP